MKEETKKKVVLTGVGLASGSISAATTNAVLNQEESVIAEQEPEPVPVPEPEPVIIEPEPIAEMYMPPVDPGVEIYPEPVIIDNDDIEIIETMYGGPEDDEVVDLMYGGPTDDDFDEDPYIDEETHDYDEEEIDQDEDQMVDNEGFCDE